MFSGLDNLCGTEEEQRYNRKDANALPSIIFCGFADAFDPFKEDPEDEREDKVVHGSQGLHIKDDERFSIDETFEEYEDDDSSVVSSSGVSVLSINDEADDIVPSNEKVDLSEIDNVDDESTIGDEEGENVQSKEVLPPVEARPISAGMTRPLRSRSTSGNYVKKNYTSTSQGSSSIQNKSTSIGNAKAESKRKELLKDLKTSISANGRYSVRVAKCLKELGNFHETWGQEEIAVTLYQGSLEIFSCKVGDHDSNVTDLYQRLAKGFQRLGEESKALQYHSNALFMINDLSGDFDLTACDIRVEISKIMFDKSFSKEAVKDLKKALKGYRMAHGDEHVKVAETVDLMACFYSDSGNPDKANNVRGELVKLMVALYGTKSVEVASSLEKWAMTHESIGDLVGALRIMKQAYVMFHDIKGPTCIDAEETLEKIGFLYSKMGRTEKAIKAHTSVALARKNRCGEQSVELAASYLILGKAYMKDSKPGRALKALTRAMTCYGKANENKNEYIAELMETLHNIGELHLMTSDYEKALKAFKKEKAVRQRYIAYDEEALVHSTKSIGQALHQLDNFSESQKAFVEALHMIDRIEGRKLQFADTMRSCGEALENFDENRAFTCYKESVQMFMANGYDEEHPSMKKAVLKLLALGLEDIASLVPGLRCSLVDGESEKFEF